MTKQAVPVGEDQPIAPTREALPAAALLPEFPGLHFSSPGFQEDPQPAFSEMPEVMPPPPARPVLPPDVRPVQKLGLMSRLFGGNAG